MEVVTNMAWEVTEVIDGDTFKISPGWTWKGESGDVVRPTGYDTPEEGEDGYDEAREKLEELILGKEVELKNVARIDRDRLVCDVSVGGKNLADFFPEYKV